MVPSPMGQACQFVQLYIMFMCVVVFQLAVFAKLTLLPVVAVYAIFFMDTGPEETPMKKVSLGYHTLDFS